jgi:hypothetical protein
MNKQTFIEILQSALLSFDGVSKTELIEQYGLNPKLVRVGVRLCDYLKSKQIEVKHET